MISISITHVLDLFQGESKKKEYPGFQKQMEKHIIRMSLCLIVVQGKDINANHIYLKLLVFYHLHINLKCNCLTVVICRSLLFTLQLYGRLRIKKGETNGHSVCPC